MPARQLRRLIARGRAVVRRLRDQVMAATRPTTAPVVTGALVDLARSKRPCWPRTRSCAIGSLS